MRDRPALNLLLVVAAALPLVLTIVDFVLVEGNRSLQAGIDRRQRLINEGTQLARVSGSLVRHIAVAAMTNHDEKLRELLSRNGITINLTPKPGDPVPAPNSSGQ
jgi:hypothetical protein